MNQKTKDIYNEMMLQIEAVRSMIGVLDAAMSSGETLERLPAFFFVMSEKQAQVDQLGTLLWKEMVGGDA